MQTNPAAHLSGAKDALVARLAQESSALLLGLSSADWKSIARAELATRAVDMASALPGDILLAISCSDVNVVHCIAEIIEARTAAGCTE